MRITLGVVAAVFFASVPSRAAEPPAGDPLATLSWFVGGTWVAEIKAPDGRATRVETRFEWAAHGRTLKFVVHFKDGERSVPQYEGMYYWNPGRKHLSMIQVDRTGNVTESVVTAEGDTLRQENQATTAGGHTRPQRVNMVRQGNDAFEFKAQVRRDGEWVDALGLTYQRQRAHVEPNKL